jgi:site-specific DNA-methyltransferase (adenine-specific)
MNTFLLGDCRDVLPTLPEASVDSIVTDPPYGISFMGKDWDSPGGLGDYPMRRTHATNMVNTGVTRQGGRRSCADFTKRQARDARAYQEWCETWATAALRVLKPA